MRSRFSLHVFQQQSLNNENYYEQFNTKFDVGVAISITRQHRVLMEYMAQESLKRHLMTLVYTKKYTLGIA